MTTQTVWKPILVEYSAGERIGAILRILILVFILHTATFHIRDFLFMA